MKVPTKKNYQKPDGACLHAAPRPNLPPCRPRPRPPRPSTIGFSPVTLCASRAATTEPACADVAGGKTSCA